MNKIDKLFFWGGIALGLFLAAISGHIPLFGLAAGYLLGFLNMAVFYRDSQNMKEPDFRRVLKKSKRSLSIRYFFMIVLFLAVGKWRMEWMVWLAVGIALGLLVSFAIKIRYIIAERGEKNE